MPRVFVSYAWQDTDHQDWVRTFTERLRDPGGCNATCDQLSAQPGDDVIAYMEQQIRDADFVLLFCTPKYKARFNGRQGGVGYEAALMSGTLARHVTANKFIPLLRSGTVDDAVPDIFAHRVLHVDFRCGPGAIDDALSPWNQLLDAVHRRRPALAGVAATPPRPAQGGNGGFSFNAPSKDEGS
jgi:hypothetical protein